MYIKSKLYFQDFQNNIISHFY